MEKKVIGIAETSANVWRVTFNGSVLGDSRGYDRAGALAEAKRYVARNGGIDGDWGPNGWVEMQMVLDPALEPAPVAEEAPADDQMTLDVAAYTVRRAIEMYGADTGAALANFEACTTAEKWLAVNGSVNIRAAAASGARSNEIAAAAYREAIAHSAFFGSAGEWEAIKGRLMVHVANLMSGYTESVYPAKPTATVATLKAVICECRDGITAEELGHMFANADEILRATPSIKGVYEKRGKVFYAANVIEDVKTPVAPAAEVAEATEESAAVFARFHKWFDGIKAEAAATEQGQAFIQAGFELWHTGGGCTAWRRDIEGAGKFVMITDGDLGHKLSAEDVANGFTWVVTVMEDEGDGYSEAQETAFTSTALGFAEMMTSQVLAGDLAALNWHAA